MAAAWPSVTCEVDGFTPEEVAWIINTPGGLSHKPVLCWAVSNAHCLWPKPANLGCFNFKLTWTIGFRAPYCELVLFPFNFFFPNNLFAQFFFLLSAWCIFSPFLSPYNFKVRCVRVFFVFFFSQYFTFSFSFSFSSLLDLKCFLFVCLFLSMLFLHTSAKIQKPILLSTGLYLKGGSMDECLRFWTWLDSGLTGSSSTSLQTWATGLSPSGKVRNWGLVHALKTQRSINCPPAETVHNNSKKSQKLQPS